MLALIGTAPFSGSCPDCLVVAASMTAGLLELVTVPIAAAYAAKAVSQPPLAGSIGRALLYASAAQAVSIAGLAGLVAASGGGSGAMVAVGVVFFLAMQVVGVPIAASLGLHGGSVATLDPGQRLAPAPNVAPTPPPSAVPPELQPPPVYAPPPPATIGFGWRF
jgi:hypothetical protein